MSFLLSFTAPGHIESKIMSKKKLTKIFNITSKLRCGDAVCIDGVCEKVSLLIETAPLKLWDAIHKKGSNISLVRPTYYKLKQAVIDIDADRVINIEKKHKAHKAKRKLAKLITRELHNNRKPIDHILKEVLERNRK